MNRIENFSKIFLFGKSSSLLFPNTLEQIKNYLQL